METITRSQQEKVEVSGQGATKQSAFSDAISKVQRKIMAGREDVFLQIIPIGIEALSATKESYTEKFCFFFLPRKKTKYAVTLLVHVTMTIVEMDTVKFVENQKVTTKCQKDIKKVDYKRT
ncbi:hypothetical protein RyT2_28580 [Pseudolactococcus yaeyamensis]